MTRVEQLVEQVAFSDPDFDLRSLSFNENLGFLQSNQPVYNVPNRIRLVGFSNPISPDGGINPEEFVTPLVNFAKLPKEERRVDRQGKGVGPRVYNVLEAFAAEKKEFQAPTVGLYMVSVDLPRLLDYREQQGSKYKRIATHAGRLVRSGFGRLENVVEDVHESYGNAGAVLLEVPPHPNLRREAHGVQIPDGVTPEFLIIRNAHTFLRKIGEAPSPLVGS